MPDKRQTSKQRRAARNRAYRESLAARRENVASPPARPVSAGSSGSSGASSVTGTATASGGQRPRSGLARLLGGGGRPGDRAVLLALIFAVASFVGLLFFRVPVDDRDEPLPSSFGGVALEARSAITGHEVTKDSVTVLDAYGGSAIALFLLPVLVTAVTFWANRTRTPRTRILTIGMIVLAAMVILVTAFGFFFMPSLIALAVASFQVRRSEMPARAAQQAAGRRRGRGRVIDVDEVDERDVDDEVDDDDVDDPGTPFVDADVVEDVPPADRSPDDRDADDDVLAELEAELEAEARNGSGPSEGDDGDARR
ncbi:MAG TPA: hypothetical protein VF743_11235 [Acidimicrobiales bacterium]